MTEISQRLGMAHPIVQAGMGGGLAGAELADAVSSAGGLGTVGIMPPREYRDALHRAREIAGGAPVAANLLVPFTKRRHVEALIAQGIEAGGHPVGVRPALETLAETRSSPVRGSC